MTVGVVVGVGTVASRPIAIAVVGIVVAVGSAADRPIAVWVVWVAGDVGVHGSSVIRWITTLRVGT